MDRAAAAFPETCPISTLENVQPAPVRWRQVAALAVLAILLLGFGIPSLGVWTGPVLGAWFIGTQKAWRGFLLLTAISLALDLLPPWHGSPLAGLGHAGWTVLATAIALLPFFFFRLTSERRPGLVASFALPFWAVAMHTLGPRFLPASLTLAGLQQSGLSSMPRLVALLGPGTLTFLVFGLASVLVWIWANAFGARKTAAGLGAYGAVVILVVAQGWFHPGADLALGWAGLAGGLLLGIWSLFGRGAERETWAEDKGGVLALLRSPRTGEPLQVVRRGGREGLESPSGECFALRKGIPVFVEQDTLTDSNKKYHQLYQIIGGFYDDSQRVICALRGLTPGQYLKSYLGLLEIRPGASVLETSVGTGLNFRYLPRGLRLFGLDLSAEMLLSCQANLRRLGLDARLFLGNAEELPFADASFDVVFHVGGINFFNDRRKAILEMIRVAKPGSRLLIADETEEHVKSAYERIPVTSRYFKNRTTQVTAPVDLVPPEMEEIRLEQLWNGRFYALTFRKPAWQAFTTTT
jgi:ubiquinone/menaquinone biosynthesis C-methylase UbiE